MLVRRGCKTGEILVALVTSGQTGAAGMPESLEAEKVLLEEWKETLLALKMEGSFAGILHIRNDTLADVVQSDETTVLYGKGYFYEELLGLKFRSPHFPSSRPIPGSRGALRDSKRLCRRNKR